MTNELLRQLAELADAELGVANSVDMDPRDTANYRYAQTALAAGREIERLRAALQHIEIQVGDPSKNHKATYMARIAREALNADEPSALTSAE